MKQPSPIKPPHFAVLLVDLFAPEAQAEAIPGDLLEEFLAIAGNSGRVEARRWYWRQTVKTVAHLFSDGFRSWRMLTAVFLAGLIGLGGIWLNEMIVVAILYRYQVYLYIDPYVFWMIYAILVGRIIISMLTGWLVAVGVRGHEMVAATTLSILAFIPAGVRLAPYLPHVNHWSRYTFPRPIVAVLLASTFLSPVAIAMGGLIGRKFKSTPTRIPATAS